MSRSRGRRPCRPWSFGWPGCTRPRSSPWPSSASRSSQHEEFFLTAAQSLFAVALLLRLRLHLLGAAALFGLFTVQFTLAFVNQADEAATIAVLTTLGWIYIALAIVLVVRDRKLLVQHARLGLLNRS